MFNELKPLDIVDCRSEEGITAGLIDSLISISRVLAKRDLSGKSLAVREALKDLYNDEDFCKVIERSMEVSKER